MLQVLCKLLILCRLLILSLLLKAIEAEQGEPIIINDL